MKSYKLFLMGLIIILSSCQQVMKTKSANISKDASISICSQDCSHLEEQINHADQ